jgi:phenylpropionate dioxygenase-like ring-hydroxylating dioxygenase large terminal subunit
MSFLRNVWYPLAWSEEVGNSPFARTLLEEPVLAYRNQAGRVIALSDTCPHRFAPLHRGKLIEDCIECPYHGLRFDSSGTCVRNPHGQGKIPPRSRLKTYPVIERDSLVWIWMGTAGAADPEKIVDLSFLNNPNCAYTRGIVMRMELKQELMLDNLLDLTHAAFLHPLNLGSEAVSRGTMTVKETDGTVLVQNFYPNGLPAPVFSATGACSADRYVDYWVDVRWNAPACLYFDAGVTPTGRPRSEGAILSSAQLLAPESASVTHYFWRMYRNFKVEDAGLTAHIEAAVQQAFATEDEPMIRAVQERMRGRDLADLKPLSLSTDAAAMRVRTLLANLKAQDSDGQSHGVGS